MQKNKPNTNPIKANFGPKIRVAKPNKPNSNPIVSQGKFDAKCVFTKDYDKKCGYG